MFDDWKGREFTATDVVSERLVKEFRATMEPYLAPVPDGCAPLAIHWCLFTTDAPMSALGQDGHPARYPFLPPVPLPRRMWAGGSLTLIDNLRVGDTVRRVTSVSDVVRKEGRTGELYFVKVDHAYFTERGCAIRERHDIVYREAASKQAAPASPPASSEERLPKVWRVETPPTLLFRYSAITFNGHRIHYDFPYATEVEGYEGLVVHGPLQATLLLNAAAVSAGKTPTTLDYRGQSPAIAGRALDVCGGTDGKFHTRSDSGTVHMTATARFS
jgi:3-methylfumaryl-CoA hydratase